MPRVEVEPVVIEQPPHESRQQRRARERQEKKDVNTEVNRKLELLRQQRKVKQNAR